LVKHYAHEHRFDRLLIGNTDSIERYYFLRFSAAGDICKTIELFEKLLPENTLASCQDIDLLPEITNSTFTSTAYDFLCRPLEFYI